jgi:hypothetical protein
LDKISHQEYRQRIEAYIKTYYANKIMKGQCLPHQMPNSENKIMKVRFCPSNGNLLAALVKYEDVSPENPRKINFRSAMYIWDIKESFTPIKRITSKARSFQNQNLIYRHDTLLSLVQESKSNGAVCVVFQSPESFMLTEVLNTNSTCQQFSFSKNQIIQLTDLEYIDSGSILVAMNMRMGHNNSSIYENDHRNFNCRNTVQLVINLKENSADTADDLVSVMLYQSEERNLREQRINLRDIQYFEDSKYIGCFSCHEGHEDKSLECGENDYSRKGKLKLIKIGDSTLEEFRAKAREARLQSKETPQANGRKNRDGPYNVPANSKPSTHQRIMNELRSVEN